MPVLPKPERLPPLLATLALLAFAAGCEEAAPTVPTRAAGQPVAPGAVTATPATPPPMVVATPDKLPSTQVATPPPATPIPVKTPTPAPIAPSGSPSGGAASADPSASPSAGASATPTPVASASASPGSLRTTNAVGDLAVSGPGYFVLATRPDPVASEDLLYTRYGHFVLKAEPQGTLPLFRLKHADQGFYVVGFQRPGATGAPAETTGTTLLTTTWEGQPAQAAGLAVDGDRNADAPSKLSFDFAGRLLLAAQPPRGTDAGPVAMFVAIAQVETPAGLVAAPGFRGIYRHAEAAGDVTLGVAMSGPGRVVGNANLVITGKLEEP